MEKDLLTAEERAFITAWSNQEGIPAAVVTKLVGIIDRLAPKPVVLVTGFEAVEDMKIRYKAVYLYHSKQEKSYYDFEACVSLHKILTRTNRNTPWKEATHELPISILFEKRWEKIS